MARIGIDCRMYSSKFTGIGRYTYELVRHLAELEQEKSKNPEEKANSNDYMLFFNKPEYDTFIPPAKNFHKVLVNAKHYSFTEQTKFFLILQKQKLDLMHFTHFNAPILYTRPSIVTIHDLTLSFFPGNKMNNPIHRAGYHLTLKSATKHAKKIIAVSKYTAKDLQKLLKIPEEKIEVIYEAVNEDFKPLEDKKAIAETLAKYGIKKPYLLYTGVWRNHKNLANLIKAFARLRNHYHIEVQLVITGREDPKYPEVRKTIQECGMQDHIILPGLVQENELRALYTDAHGYVFPSLYEGFGLSPLEAMKCSVPVAVSKASCIPEICGVDNALFFDPYDPNDMAEKMATLCTNEPVRTELIKNGLSHIKTFSWKKMSRQTLKLYEHVLETL